MLAVLFSWSNIWGECLTMSFNNKEFWYLLLIHTRQKERGKKKREAELGGNGKCKLKRFYPNSIWLQSLMLLEEI